MKVKLKVKQTKIKPLVLDVRLTRLIPEFYPFLLGVVVHTGQAPEQVLLDYLPDNQRRQVEKALQKQDLLDSSLQLTKTAYDRVLRAANFARNATATRFLSAPSVKTLLDDFRARTERVLRLRPEVTAELDLGVAHLRKLLRAYSPTAVRQAIQDYSDAVAQSKQTKISFTGLAYWLQRHATATSGRKVNKTYLKRKAKAKS